MKIYYIEHDDFQIVATGETEKKAKDLFMKMYNDLHDSGYLSYCERFDTWDELYNQGIVYCGEYILGEVYFRGHRQDFTKKSVSNNKEQS
tara:strand:- start:1091 stop:1360 length:270 start_codon:yes stop_codon:yes gene_type:complete